MRDFLLIILALVIFIGGIKLGETGKEYKVVDKVYTEYISIAWWFKDATLYWAFDGKYEPANYLNFQLDHQIPPQINYEPIERIMIFQDIVVVLTKDKFWKVHYSKDMDEWYVDDWESLTLNR